MSLSPETPRTAAEAAKIREDYEELIRTPGWRRFVDYITDRYSGGGYFNAMGNALKSGDQMKPLVYHETACEIMRAINHPVVMIQDLRGSSE